MLKSKQEVTKVVTLKKEMTEALLVVSNSLKDTAFGNTAHVSAHHGL